MSKSKKLEELEDIYRQSTKAVGDEAIFLIVMDVLYFRLFSFGQKYSGDAEATQDALINTVLVMQSQTAQKRKEIEDISAFLYRVVFNKAANEFRKLQKNPLFRNEELNINHISDLQHEDYDEFWNMENPKAYEYLDTCKGEVLNSFEEKVYNYQFLNRLKHSKIAIQMGISEKKLKAVKRKMKRNLLNCLGKKKANLSE